MQKPSVQTPITHNDTHQRLFVDCALFEGATVALDRAQANYLLNVLRLKQGARVLVFNGQVGEWLAQLHQDGRKSALLVAIAQMRPQPMVIALHYYFAPLKHARLDYLVQKAAEMGVSHLVPVLTAHTQVARLNLERMRANAIEAVEQCGTLSLPEILDVQPLASALASRPAQQWLVFCDEDAVVESALPILARLQGDAQVGVLIGPEGGFSAAERAAIVSLPKVLSISLGSRVLRADTAGVAALALVQAARGF